MNAEEKMVARALSRIRASAMERVEPAKVLVERLEATIKCHPAVALDMLSNIRNDIVFRSVIKTAEFYTFLSKYGL